MTAEIKKFKSSKSDKEYECLVLTLRNGYVKRVFLDSAEMFMFKEDLQKDVLSFRKG